MVSILPQPDRILKQVSGAAVPPSGMLFCIGGQLLPVRVLNGWAILMRLLPLPNRISLQPGSQVVKYRIPLVGEVSVLLPQFLQL